MKYRFIASGEQLIARAAHFLEHHPRQVTVALAAAMIFGGGGAFAVASFAPEPPQGPVREVVEDVQPLPLQPQLQSLDGFSINLYRSDATRSSDTAESLLARLGIADAEATAFLRSDPATRGLVLGRAGRAVSAEATDHQQLVRLNARWVVEDDGTFRRLVVERGTDGRLHSRIEIAPLVANTRLASATIHSSLFAAADEARVPDGVVMQMINMFSGEIDFYRSLRDGDRFNVVYETLEADGEPLRTGRVLSAEFVNKGRSHAAMWFQESGRKGSYYSLDGKSLASPYLASPLEFSRVTSGFALNRLHPILNQWKAHLGVDYGARIGTPVRSIGDGVVEFAGVQNGFGNVVIVRHNKTDETVYAHLSRIGVRRGQPVAQGQNVGAVGMTGWATGPHLHFEFRVNGLHRDPQLMARRAESQPLSEAALPQFRRTAAMMRVELAAAAVAAVARAD